MPKILIDLDINDDLKNNIEEKLKTRKLKIEKYVLELIKNDIDSVIDFNDNYSYNFSFNKLFFKNQEIKLTSTEDKLFRLLLNNANNLVSLKEIENVVWTGKYMSRFTLRNKIKSLRDKTEHDLIVNSSNNGYLMLVNYC
jgi:DNA-binding response OmpR family regulator